MHQLRITPPPGISITELLTALGYFEVLVLEDAAAPGTYDVLFDNSGNMLFEVTY